MITPQLRRIVAIAGAELRRFLRDRSNIFFVFIFPLLLVLVLGSQFGGGGPNGRVTIAGPGGELQHHLTELLDERDIAASTSDNVEATLSQVARGRTDAALVVPAAAEQAFAAGDSVRLEVVSGASATSAATAQAIRAALDTTQLRDAQLETLTGAGLEPEEAEHRLSVAEGAGGPEFVVESLDPLAEQFAGLGQFDLGASSQLLLFTFLSTLTGAATLIQARREKVIARALSTPTSATQVLVGQAAGRWVIALFQGAYIMVATALLFGVSWGNWALSLIVLALFAAVAAGFAMVLGALVDNESAAAGIGVGVGLVLAGLGGGMAPLEIFPDSVRQVSMVTPHSWAYEAFAEIQRRDGSLLDIAPQLGVLVGFAVVALALGSLVLRRSVARAL